MDTIQRQSIDQNLRKLAETAGFSDIHAQDYSGYFNDLKDKIYLNGEKYRPQDISPTKNFRFFKFEKRTSCLSGMALLYLRKVDYIIRNIEFSLS